MPITDGFSSSKQQILPYITIQLIRSMYSVDILIVNKYNLQKRTKAD